MNEHERRTVAFCANKDGGRGIVGSGVIVIHGGNTYVLTARHVLDDWFGGEPSVELKLFDGSNTVSRVIEKTKWTFATYLDLAYAQVQWNDPWIEAFELADVSSHSPPNEGELCGYPFITNFSYAQYKCQRNGRYHPDPSQDTWRTEDQVNDFAGFSGGAVADGNRLVGVAIEQIVNANGQVPSTFKAIHAGTLTQVLGPQGATDESAVLLLPGRKERIRPTLAEYVLSERASVLSAALLWIVAAVVFALLTANGLHPGDQAPLLFVHIANFFVVVVAGLDFVFRVWEERVESGRVLYGNAMYAGHRASIDQIWKKFGKNAIESEIQFKIGVLALLVGWFGIYACLVYADIRLLSLGATQSRPIVDAAQAGEAEAIRIATAIGATSFNGAATLGMFVCFYVMSFITTGHATRGQAYDGGVVRGHLTKLIGLMVAVWLLWTSVNAAVVFFVPAWRESSFVMDVASGVVAAVVFGAWVARMDSKYIDANPNVLLALFLYVAIQPLWVIAKVPAEIREAGVSDGAQLVLMWLALALKLLLYVSVRWLLQTGRLIFYFARARALYVDVFKQWRTDAWRNGPQGGRDELSFEGLGTLAWGCCFSIAIVGLVALSAGGIRSVSSFKGFWSAEITWTDRDFVKDKKMVLGEANKPMSAGLLVLEGEGSVLSGLSRWTFRNQPEGTPDPDAAMLVVAAGIPNVEAGERLTIPLSTIERRLIEPGKCADASADASKAVGRVGPSEFFLSINGSERNPDGVLRGKMCDRVTQKCPGSVTLTRLTPKEYFYRISEHKVATKQ